MGKWKGEYQDIRRGSQLTRACVLSRTGSLEQMVCTQRLFLLRSFLALYKMTMGNTGLLQNGIEAEFEDRSMAGTFCSCRYGSTEPT